jgi:uncharacterized membrane protein
MSSSEKRSRQENEGGNTPGRTTLPRETAGESFLPDDGGHLSASWEGPLPPPAILQQFNSIVENGAERIFRMAELEQSSRIEHAKIVLSADAKAQEGELEAIKRGHYLGAAISIIAIIAAVYTAFLGYAVVSVALVGVPLMSVVRALMSQPREKAPIQEDSLEPNRLDLNEKRE